MIVSAPNLHTRPPTYNQSQNVRQYSHYNSTRSLDPHSHPLRSRNSPFTQTPYATIKNGIHKVKTTTLKGERPEWKEEHMLEVSTSSPTLKIKVKDHKTDVNLFSVINRTIGSANLDLNETRVLQGETFEGYVSLEHGNYPAGKIYLKICLAQL